MFRNILLLIRFDKPIGSLLLLWPTLWALWTAFAGTPPVAVLFAFVMGVFLTRSAGCAINDYADRDFDGKVKRTENRPLVTKALSARTAIIVTAILSLIAFVIAALFLRIETILWSLPALFLFITYPFFKRFFPLPQLYLGVAFSFGIPMAFVESLGATTMVTWILFVANVAWVLAYDTIYALVDLSDDVSLGIKTSAITFGRFVIPIVYGCYVLFVFLMIFIGNLLELDLVYYISLAIAILFILYVCKEIVGQNREKCFKAFLFNNNIGLVIFIGLIVSYAFKNHS